MNKFITCVTKMNRVYTFSGEIPQPIARLGKQQPIKFSCEVLLTGNEGPNGEPLDAKVELTNVTFAKNVGDVDIQLKVKPNDPFDNLTVDGLTERIWLTSIWPGSYTHYVTFTVHSPFYDNNTGILNAFLEANEKAPMATIGNMRYQLDFYINTRGIDSRVGFTSSSEYRQFYASYEKGPKVTIWPFFETYSKRPEAGYVSELVLRLQEAPLQTQMFRDVPREQPRLVPTKIDFISSPSQAPVADTIANQTLSPQAAPAMGTNIPWPFIAGSVAVCAGTYVLLR